MILLDVLNKTRIKMLSQFPGVHLSGLYDLNLKIGTDSAGICRCTPLTSHLQEDTIPNAPR
jgi:hypothetical protein